MAFKYNEDYRAEGKTKIIVEPNSAMFKPHGMAASCTGGHLFYESGSPFVVLEYFDLGSEGDRSRRIRVPATILKSGTEIGMEFEGLGIKYWLSPSGAKIFFERN